MQHQEGVEINLTNLPDLALNRIAEYLEPKDIINLCDSSPCLEDLRRFLPKYQDITGEDFKKSGPYGGRFETYFDGPEMNQGAYSIKMNFQWKDLGWGNQRGQIWIQLMRNGKVLADTREDYFALAPHI